MFGFLYALFHAGVAGADAIDKSFVDAQNRERSSNLGDRTYYGRNGGLYLTENGRHVVKGVDRVTGHDVIKDFKTGQVYYDLTVEKIKNQKEKYKEAGKSVYFPITNDQKRIMQMNRERAGMKYKHHIDYIDIKTDHIVVIKYINGYSFYMDLFDGKLLRLSDSFIEGKYSEKTLIKDLAPNVIIYLFNKRQDRLRQDSRYAYAGSEWTQEVFYLCNNISMRMTPEGKLIQGYKMDSNFKIVEEPLKATHYYWKTYDFEIE